MGSIYKPYSYCYIAHIIMDSFDVSNVLCAPKLFTTPPDVTKELKKEIEQVVSIYKS